MQQGTVGLVHRHDPFDCGEFVVGRGEQVPFDPEMAEHRGSAPKRDGVGAAGRMGPIGADVGAHELGWDQVGRASLDTDSVKGIVAVAGPHAVGAGEDAEVDAATARGATLDLDVGVCALDLVDQPVDGAGLGLTGGSAGAVGGCDEIAVHVPLEVRDVVVVEQ